MGTIKESIIKNVKWLTVSLVSSKLIRLFVVLFIAKTIVPSEYGAFVYMLSVINLCYVFSDLGISLVFQKEFYVADRPGEMSTIILSKLGLTLIGCVASLIVPSVFSGIAYSFMYYMMAGFVFLTIIKEFFFIFVRYKNHVQIEFYVQISEAIIQFLFVLGLFVVFQPNIEYLALAYLIGSLVGWIVLLFFLVPYLRSIHWHFDGVYLRDLYASFKSLPMASIFVDVLRYVDVVIIKYILGFDAVGIFDIAKKMYQISTHLIAVLSKSITPMLSQSQKNMQVLGRLFERNIVLVLLVFIPLTYCFVVFDALIIKKVLSEAYFKSISLLIYFWILFFVTAVYKPFSITLLFVGKINLHALINIFVSIISTMLLPLFLVVLGIKGAIIPLIAGIILKILMTAYSLQSLFKWSDSFLKSLRNICFAFIVSVGSVLLLMYVQPEWISLRAFLSTSVFYGVLMLMKDMLIVEYMLFFMRNVKRMSTKFSNFF